MTNPISLNKKIKIKIKPLHIIAAFIVAALIVLLIYGMNRTINKSLYTERVELLGRLTESSADIINNNIEHGYTVASLFSEDASYHLSTGESIEEFLLEEGESEGYGDLMLFLVDESGKYYARDGVFGKLTDLTYYTEQSDDAIAYISYLPHMGSEKSYMIFRNRLPEPVRVSTERGETTIVFSGLLYDIDEIKDLLSQEFAGDNNTFIYDDTTGVMLYKDFGIRLLIDGYNIYDKLYKCELNYGADPAEIENACRRGEATAVSIQIAGTEYYFCSASVDPINWSVAFIVQEEYLDAVSGNAFRNIIIYIALIAIILGISVIVLAASVLRNRASSKSIKEITELNTKLDSATRAKSDFLSNMSHDIRTPINGIMGMTAIAKNVEGNPQKTTECLGKIEGASKHLLSLINDVLDMSRIEQGKTVIASEPLDLRALCDNCLSIIKGQTEGRELEIEYEENAPSPRVFGDDLHLRQILINILGNAVKFTPDGGKITLRLNEENVKDDKTQAIFEIEDTGIGMKPEFVHKIFDAFAQEDGGSRTKYKGTGLGMSITKQLTELMGGSIKVESELNKGSKFTVTIPFNINTAPEEAREQAVKADNLNGVRLLLAEDNELNMEIATELLTEAGASVTGAADGQIALETFKNAPIGSFDAILMDIMMPNMNGLEATKAIRALKRGDASIIPIIAMTANAFESDVKATREAGMNAHLSKPINIASVIETVSRFVNK